MNRHDLLTTLVCAFSFVILSCNQDQSSKRAAVEKKIVCYQSVSEGDTAWFSIDTAQKVIRGQLSINYTSKREVFDGKFTGKMLGDTIKGYFDYKINKGNPPYRNPVAFLKSADKLKMGVGQFMTVMGTAHFDDKVPIDYDKGRFIFEEVICKP